MFLVGFWLELLTGDGKADNEWTSTQFRTAPESEDSPSFAPRGAPTAYSKFRRKLPSALTLDVAPTKGAIAQIHDSCSVGMTLVLSIIIKVLIFMPRAARPEFSIGP